MTVNSLVFLNALSLMMLRVNDTVWWSSWPFSFVARPAVLNLNFGGTTASYTFTVREAVSRAWLGTTSSNWSDFSTYQRQMVQLPKIAQAFNESAGLELVN
jgi:hypothetical protein